jgi:PAS domain S-box-containing protein
MVPLLNGLSASRDNVFFRCVEDSTEAIMITDLEGRLVYVNPAWQRIFEYPWEEAIGKTPAILRSQHGTPDFYKAMWAQILNPQIASWRGELVNKSKSGKLVPVDLTITPIRHEGALAGYMGVALDIRKKKEMEAQILQQDRLASVGLLASGLAHEIGTPLGVVRGRAELLKKAKDQATLEAGLDIIIQQIDRVSKLITSLLKLSRGKNREGAYCDLNAVIKDSIELMAQKFREHGIDVAINVPTKLEVEIDHGLLEQVLINLFLNATHAIQEAISRGRDSDHFIRIRAEKRGERVLIYVSDTGTGINPEDQKQLFRAFFTTKPVGEGTGLGLSISAQIISEAGGELKLYDSQSGVGTTFLIELRGA